MSLTMDRSPARLSSTTFLLRALLVGSFVSMAAGCSEGATAKPDASAASSASPARAAASASASTDAKPSSAPKGEDSGW
jgi:hypothetical protein